MPCDRDIPEDARAAAAKLAARPSDEADRLLRLARRKLRDASREERDACIRAIRIDLLGDLTTAAAAREIARVARPGARGGSDAEQARRREIRARLEQLGDLSKFPHAERIRKVIENAGDSLVIESPGDNQRRSARSLT